MIWLRFAILHFIVSALSCAVVGVPLYIRLSEYWYFSLVAQTAISFLLLLTLVSALLTFGLRMLNGGAMQRHVSAVVLVFLFSVIGIVTSLIIGRVFEILLSWLVAFLPPLGAIILKLQLEIADYLDSFYVVSGLPSLHTILWIAVFGSLFGLPLARIGKGIRFVDAWGHQTGKRWMLFWRCGAGTLALSLIWTVVSYVAYTAFVKPERTTSMISDPEAVLRELLSYQPTVLELSFNFGMGLLFLSLAVGIVAYVAEHVRQQFG